MPSPGETDAPRRPSIFLSYPSEDRMAARLLRDGLSAGGLEVWYDEEELNGGDAWDQKIRRQIRECDYFMPVISAQSESRREGYFRREWRLAVERTLDMADDHLFLLPVVIDGTEQSGARVPEKFFTVQWLRVPGGQPTPALTALCQRLLSGDADAVPPPPRRVPPTLKSSSPIPPPPNAPPPAPAIPPFPNQEPGQPVKFWVHVIMWLAKAVWIQFGRLPRIIRLLILIYLAYLVFFSSTTRVGHKGAIPPVPPHASEVQTKLNSIAARYEAGEAKGDAVKLGTDIARELAAEFGDKASLHPPLLVIPFASDPATPDEEKAINSTFVMLYGRVSMARPGKVKLVPEHLGPAGTVAAQLQGQSEHAQYVMLGGIETLESRRVLTVEILQVKNSTLTWIQHYPLAGLDADKIAGEVEKNLPDLDDDEDN